MTTFVFENFLLPDSSLDSPRQQQPQHGPPIWKFCCFFPFKSIKNLIMHFNRVDKYEKIETSKFGSPQFFVAKKLPGSKKFSETKVVVAVLILWLIDWNFKDEIPILYQRFLHHLAQKSKAIMLLGIIESNWWLESYNDLTPVPCEKWISFVSNRFVFFSCAIT